MNIFVGNLATQVTEEQLKTLFAPFGSVQSVKIIMDHYSGSSKGFGFVEMPESPEAEQAMTGLDKFSYQGQALIVNPARPKTDKFNPNERSR